MHAESSDVLVHLPECGVTNNTSLGAVRKDALHEDRNSRLSELELSSKNLGFSRFSGFPSFSSGIFSQFAHFCTTDVERILSDCSKLSSVS